MKNALSEPVLVLNKYWQAVNETTVEEALKQMYTDVATALVWTDDQNYVPLQWAEWVKLPVREQDSSIHTPKMIVRAPTIIASCNFTELPKSHPPLEPRYVGQRDKFRCQYTGVYAPDGNIDHVIPKARGGQNTWTNVVWCKREINSMKGKSLNEEIGLKLLRKPTEPLVVSSVVKLRTRMKTIRPEWESFLLKGKGEE